MQNQDNSQIDKIGKVLPSCKEDIQPFVVQQLYIHARISLLFLLLATLMMGGLLTQAETLPLTRVLIWSSALVFVILGRIVNVFSVDEQIFQSKITFPLIKRYYRQFVIPALITAILIGLAVPLFLPHLEEGYLEFALYIYIIGVAAGAIAALFPSIMLVTCYTILIILPLIWHLLNLPDRYAMLDAVAVLLLILILASIAGVSRRYMFQVHEQRKRLQAKEEELRALFLQTPTPIFYFDSDLKIRKFNEAFLEFFDIPADLKLEGFDLRQLKFDRAIALMEEVLEKGEPCEYEGPYIATFTSNEYWIYAKIAPLFNAEGKIIGGIASFQDKTIEVQSIEYLEKLASLDPLTELGNRRSFLQQLQGLVQAQKSGDPLSLLYFIDLNQFKPINDTLGHHFGDQVLVEVAHLLQEAVPDKAQVFRHGGDEFVILDPFCCRTREEAEVKGAAFSKKINDILKRELVIDKYHLSMQASIGIVIISPHMNNSDEIIRHADISMYQAKSQRREYAFYDSSMDEARRKNFFLRQGLTRKGFLQQLELRYQPIYSLNSHKFVGAEALVRWRHPTLGLLEPNEFIPLAIDSGDIRKIGQWVREEVCRTIARLKTHDLSLDFISVNVDAHELGYEDFLPTLQKMLRNNDIASHQLVLEITENSLINNFDRYHWIIESLKKLGIKWAIDDFGVGYSSLSYLQRLSFSVLKIDQSFITSITENNNSAFLVDHITKIASHLGYQIIAEGIENEAQERRLQEISPDILCQGFYFAHPLPEEEFFKRLLSKEG